MNIGFVSTWMERGAAYVTKSYIELLENDNKVFVYARGGEEFPVNDPTWNLPYVTWGLKLYGMDINYNHFKKWIIKNNIETIFFNEQRNIDIILQIKKNFPEIKLGSYIDYYKEDTIEEFNLFDFLICNTKRHYSVFKEHPQAFYVPWGTDTNLFNPRIIDSEELIFFHSVGMSRRKGSKLLIEAFIDGELYKHSKLIIHTQTSLEILFGIPDDSLKDYNIEIIEKTVTAPGLYYLGHVYVYPTTLDGLGLTLYEALSCGLPVITSDNAPMNEVVDNTTGYLVNIERYHSRSDGYYWPLSIVSKQSLINAMQHFVDCKDDINVYRDNARSKAEMQFNWKDRTEEINSIFNNTVIVSRDINYKQLIKTNNRKKIKSFLKTLVNIAPSFTDSLFSRIFYKK